MDFDWILEAMAPLRFPLAQGLWLLCPWLGPERIARWIASLEGASRAQDHQKELP
mgnify:CR=1 FL=1